MKKLISTIILSATLLCGCFSTKSELNLTAAYPFEGRYTSKNEIVIDSMKAEFDKNDSIWILSNRTIYNLLVDVSDSEDKIVFKNSKINDFNRELIKKFNDYKKYNSDEDDFAGERFIWEEWELTDSTSVIQQ